MSFALVYGFSRRQEIIVGIASPESRPDLWGTVLQRDVELAGALLDREPPGLEHGSLTVSFEVGYGLDPQAG